MRTCLLAVRLARELGHGEDDAGDTYYAALLQHVGCTASAHELSLAFGDEIALNRAGARTDFSKPVETFSTFIPELTAGLPLVTRVRLTAAVLVRGKRLGDYAQHANCEVASATARRLGLPDRVERALHQMFEWWNGKGEPSRLHAEEIDLSARIVQVASHGVLFGDIGGAALSAASVRQRSGSYLDPAIAEAFATRSAEFLDELEDVDVLEAVLEAEPEPRRTAAEWQLDDMARAFGDIVDLKSPFFHGHSARVAELAEAAARKLRLEERDCVALRRGGLMHDLGRAAVPTSIWEKTAPLTALEWEQVRLHPYHSERVLARSPALAPLAPIVGMHHERQDGSGYYRELTARSISLPARVLAAADAFSTLTETRPHRAALEPSAAREKLQDEVRRGRLDSDAAAAVLDAAGADGRKRPARPAGLSERELEVLRLVAEGLSNRQIARRLVISPRTAEHHVQHVYAKIGVSTRAGAALYALEHDLLS